MGCRTLSWVSPSWLGGTRSVCIILVSTCRTLTCPGDLIADTAMAKRGSPRMGFSAAIGGPLFNLLLGIGLPFTIQVKEDFQTPPNTSLLDPRWRWGQHWCQVQHDDSGAIDRPGGQPRLLFLGPAPHRVQGASLRVSTNHHHVPGHQAVRRRLVGHLCRLPRLGHRRGVQVHGIVTIHWHLHFL